MAKIHALATDLSVDPIDWVYQKSGHHNTQIGWWVATESGLPLKYSDLVNRVTEWRFHLLYNPQATELVQRKNGVLKQQSYELENLLGPGGQTCFPNH